MERFVWALVTVVGLLPSCAAQIPREDRVELRIPIPKGWRDAMEGETTGLRKAPMLVLILEDLEASRLPGRTLTVYETGATSTEELGSYTFVGDPKRPEGRKRSVSIRIPLTEWAGPKAPGATEARLVVMCEEGAAIRFRRAVLDLSK